MVDIKIIFALLAFLINCTAYVPYLRDMFAHKTKPHAYTWLIWSVTLSVATAGVWYGGGGYAAVALGLEVLFTLLVFLLTFTYGTRNITSGDTITFLLALAAVFVWAGLKNPFLSVCMVTAIDAAGYWPSIRKSFAEPWSESLSTWVLFNFSILFSVLALNAYNILTLMYVVMSFALNLALVIVCFSRRKEIPKPAL